jgi:ribosomal protein S18 acetylase RimI-like enzyme
VKLNLRAPTQSDINELAALHTLCWQQAYRDILPADYLASLTVEQRVEMWRANINHPDRFVRCAFVEGIMAGFVSSGPAREAARNHADGEIYAINVLHHFYGAGVGQALFDASMDEWRGRHGKAIALLVFTKNLRARRFYERNGGVDVGGCETEVNGVKFVERVYRFEMSAGRK